MRFCCPCCTWRSPASSPPRNPIITSRPRPELPKPARQPSSVRGNRHLGRKGECMSTDLIELVQRLGQPRVLVVGDVMLDRYVWGDAERISQEAPVILLRADRREERLGGASSVATMLRALGARVALAGVVGNDPAAGHIRQMLENLAIDHEAVITDPDRPSTVKERYIGRAQHK